jgi:hypothetical protein
MLLKNAELLSSFIGYQMSFLPKNRRQTAFLKFISRVLFNFKGEQRDIVGLRLRFKGRFNR